MNQISETISQNDFMENHIWNGKKVKDDEGLPGGPAIVGDKLFTRGSKEGEEPTDTALAPVTGSTPVGRLSWEQLFPSQ